MFPAAGDPRALRAVSTSGSTSAAGDDLHHGPAGRERPATLSSVTRYLSGAAYTDPLFASRVIAEVVEDEHRAVVPSYEFDIEPVLRHCFRARNLWLGQDALLSVVLLLGLLLAFTGTVLALVLSAAVAVPLMLHKARANLMVVIASGPGTLLVLLLALSVVVPAFIIWTGSYDLLNQTRTEIIGQLLLFCVAAGGVLTWFRYTALRVLTTELASGVQHVAPRITDHRIERRLTTAGKAQYGNIVLYGGADPFLGTGKPVRAWSMVLDLRTEVGLDGALPQRVPLDPVELNRHVKRSLAALRADTLPERERLAGLQIRDLLVAAGERDWDYPLLDPHLRMPFSHAGPAAVESVIRHPQASARHFLRVTTGTTGQAVLDRRGEELLPAEDEEVEVTAFVHFAVEGGMFYMEYVSTVLGPIDDRFHHIDRLPIGAGALVRIGIGQALRQLPVAIAVAPARLVRGMVQRSSVTRRMDRAQRINLTAPRYDYGARTSVRALASSRDPDTYISLLDADKYSKLIERRLTGAVLDYFVSKGVDTAEYRRRVSVIHNEGTILINSTATGPVASGSNATATVNLVESAFKQREH
jgi:hypothetical protein